MLNQAILKVAQQYIGLGEEGENNRGFWVNIFRRGRKIYGGGEWCATFASFVVEQACYGEGIRPYRVRHRSARKFFRRCEKYGSLVGIPKPGDIELRRRPNGHHVEFVTKVMDNGSRTNLGGNIGRFPAKVKHRWRMPVHKDENHVAFVRLRS